MTQNGNKVETRCFGSFPSLNSPNIDGICSNMGHLKAESCWAALILYRIGNRTRYTIQIQIQNGLYLLVRGDTPGDTSQPCLLERFCKMFSETGRWALVQLTCCPSKQGELSENVLLYKTLLTSCRPRVYISPARRSPSTDRGALLANRVAAEEQSRPHAEPRV